MKPEELHIISLNIPFPANYGGVIDIFYKIKALSEKGIKIHLHCFEYGRERSIELNKYCASVNYYHRKTNIFSWLSLKPFIVYSRRNNQLLKNLLNDQFPILFEGLHTTYFLDHKLLKSRLKIVRAHNIEHEYYEGLKRQEKNLVRRFFFHSEAIKLKLYEQRLKKAQLIAAISPNDTQYFSGNYSNAFWLPPFHPNDYITTKPGMGSYILYHGDLSVTENVQAIQFLFQALSNQNITVVLAGRNPSELMRKEVSEYHNFVMVSNPSFKEMERLINDAHVIALPTFQATGIKLKLIASLFLGRHIVANPFMVENTGLEKLVHIASEIDSFRQVCVQLFDQPFTTEMRDERIKILESNYTNTKNADLLIKKISGDALY